MGNYTKEEWRVVEYGGTTVYALNEQGTNRFCLLVQPGYIYNSQQITKRTPQQELEANAQLISAAPELLEALELLYDHARLYMQVSDNVTTTVEEAILKAKGE